MSSSEIQQFGLIDQSSLIAAPQEVMTSATSDYTSVFGTFDNSFLKGISLLQTDENNETPFTYDNMMKNVFGDEMEAIHHEYDEDDDEVINNLTFEC